MKLLFYLVFTIFISISLQAQQKTITGIITSESDGMALPGVNVIIKGSTTGVQSNFDGFYKILAKKNDVLVFTYIGMRTKEVTVKDDVVINIILEEDSAHLDEVVISAMGIVKESRVAIRGMTSYESEKKLFSTVKGSSTSDQQPQSGQLTAGEINDMEKWDEWLKALKSADNRKIQEHWQFGLEQKIDIHVKNPQSKPLNNINVAIYNSMNEPIMIGRTDFNGNVTLFKDLSFKTECDFYTVQIVQNGKVIGKKITKNQSKIEFVLEEQRTQTTNNIDVMFTIDATGSMGDEIDYLKSELKDIIGRLDKSIDQKRVALTFYRDHGDEYLVRDFDFTTNIDDAKEFLSRQSAAGGGDYEEAVEEALKVSMSKSWQMDSKSKLLFLLLDAPPHYTQENVDIIKKQIKIAQEKGIKIIPIVASGANKNVEFLMRYFSVCTNGTYVFLTDDSGIGNPHIKPTTDDFKVEKLNDLIVRLIEKYSGVKS